MRNGYELGRHEEMCNRLYGSLVFPRFQEESKSSTSGGDLYSYYNSDGPTWLITHLAPGISLYNVLLFQDYTKQSSWDRLSTILDRVKQELSNFHEKSGGMIHGDPHLSNIMYDSRNGNITLIDFGNCQPKSSDADVQLHDDFRTLAQSFRRTLSQIKRYRYNWSLNDQARLKQIDNEALTEINNASASSDFSFHFV